MSALGINMTTQDKPYTWDDTEPTNHNGQHPKEYHERMGRVKELQVQADEILEGAIYKHNVGAMSDEEWYEAHELAGQLLIKATELREEALWYDQMYWQIIESKEYHQMTAQLRNG